MYVLMTPVKADLLKALFFQESILSFQWGIGILSDNTCLQYDFVLRHDHASAYADVS